MEQYVLSSKSEKILYLYDKIALQDASSATLQELEDYNRSLSKNKRIFNKLYQPDTKHVLMETYIIPVEEGNITGYLFKKKEASSGLSPLIVYYHSGGFTLGNMEICKAICSNICKYTSSMVLAVDYRLSPTFKFPVPLNDCYNAFLWAAGGIKYWKLDPKKIFVMGSCAGGNLAISVCKRCRDEKGPTIAGLILEDPLTDCRLRTNSVETHKHNPLLNKKDLNFFINSYANEPKDILNPFFSPLLALDFSRLPQTLIFSSEYSPLSDDAELFAEALSSADTPVKLIFEEKKLHGFMRFPSWDRYEDEMATISVFLEGKVVQNINLLTKRQRRRLRSMKPVVEPSADDAL